MAEYQIADQNDSRKLAEALAEHDPRIAVVLERLATTEMALDEFIYATGRSHIEALLLASATEVAGPKQPGRKRTDRDVRWYGYEQGVVQLNDRKLRVEKPRLRKGKGRGAEAPIPAYVAMQRNPRVTERMLQIMFKGVSTRNYREVLPEMADSVGVSKSAVSREMIEACEEKLRELAERRFDDKTILVVYIDGVRFGDWHVVVAVSVDETGCKHVLGLREGSTENATVVTALLTDLVERGVRADRHRLFIIDGSKALRTAIHEVYGSTMPIQRCRSHKERNVQDHLPKEQRPQVASAMKAAWKMNADEGKRKLNDLARWLEREHPSAAASLREGLDEMFTINRLNLSPLLRRCLGTTNIIESSFSGTVSRTRRVTYWRNGTMVVRWAAAALLDTEKRYKRIMGHRDLWQLQAHLLELDAEHGLVTERKVG